MVCVDTSFIVALERRKQTAIEKMKQLEEEEVYTAAISAVELYAGAYDSKERTRALKEAKNLLDRFAILNLDYESGKIWGELAHNLPNQTR